MSGALAPNMVVVVMDGARASNLAPGMGPRAYTPEIARLGSEGTVFSRALSPGNWTLPSHLSMLTGTQPWVHGLRTFRQKVTSFPTIASWLFARGYDTGVFTEEVHLVAGYGLEEGYAERFCPVPVSTDEDRTVTNRLFGHAPFAYSPAVRRVMSGLPVVAIPFTLPNWRAEVAFKNAVTSEVTLNAFGAWLARRDRTRPFHALLNFVDPHEPYLLDGTGGLARRYASVPRFYLLSVPEVRDRVPWSAVEAAYLRCLTATDRKVGKVRELLEQNGVFGRTLLIVTSDHGQSFGEGGNIYHGCGATDSVLRVPLVVHPPEGVAVPSAIDRWVSLCELPSWMKATALGRAPYDDAGYSTIPFPTVPPPAEPAMAEGGPASDPNLSLEGIGPEHRWNHRLIAAYHHDEKYVLDLFVGDVRRWSGPGDLDRQVPEQLGVSEAKAAIASVFDLTDPRALLDVADQGRAPRRAPLADRRMRSWGYD